MRDYFGFLIRFIISATVITTAIVYQYDFKVPLIILSVIYFFQYVILHPFLSDRLLKYIIYIIDYLFIGYVVFVTDNIYLSLFSVMLILNITTKLDMIILLLFMLPISGISLYKYGFYEFTILFLYVGFLLSIFEIFRKNLESENRYNQLLNLSKEIYRDNLICSDKLDFYQRYYNINMAIKKLKEGDIKLQEFTEALYKNLNCDTAIVIDRVDGSYSCEGNHCYKADVIKSFISDKDVESLKSNLNVKFVFIREVGEFSVILIYKDYIMVDKELLDIIT
ncbi:MAG: hypothetical protein ABWJ98_03430 [Hydrogenothermaceae bacterium]